MERNDSAETSKWKLVDEYTSYKHSSARFYELGEVGIYNVIHYENVMYIPAESSAQISL